MQCRPQSHDHRQSRLTAALRYAMAGPRFVMPMAKSVIPMTAAAVFGSLLALANTAAAETLLQTNSTWKVTPTNPGGTSWNTDPGFDDSSWQNATVLYDVEQVTGNSYYAGTYGIWSSGGQFSTTELQIWIRKTFTLTSTLTAASLIVGCDDDCTVWVNGTQVINDQNGFANNNTADVTSNLSVGTNLIAYIARDVVTANHSTWLQLNGEYDVTVTLDDLQDSLVSTASSGAMVLSSYDLVLNGAHGRPFSRRVAAGEKTFWLAGDWGSDNHGARSGDIGLAELGLGHNFGPVQVNVSLGKTWAKQDLTLNGRAETDGTYLLAEALIPVRGNLWATVAGYYNQGEADIRRGYLINGGTQQDYSTGKPDADTWGLRARLEWDNAWQAAGAGFSPYIDLSHSTAKLDAYTETGGSFPASFDSRKEKATDLRAGVDATSPIANGMSLIGKLEAAHRFEEDGARISGDVLGLGFDFDGQKNDRDWLRAGVGLEGKVGGGMGSVMLNATTAGEVQNAWVALNWQKTF